MIKQLKTIIKKYIPSQFMELISSKGISLIKIPRKKGVISDLFIFRIEKGWKTYFECLHMETLLSNKKNRNDYNVNFVFYDHFGNCIGQKKINIKNSLKTTINISKITNELGINQDGLFAVFHPYKKNLVTKYDGFLAERGYIGYANPKLGSIKGFVHGNLDAIAKYKSNKNYQLLGNYSFIDKEYNLQHILYSGNKYELYLVNSTNKTQNINIYEIAKNKTKIYNYRLQPNGFLKHYKIIKRDEKNLKIIIKSKLYIARPVIFKIMNKSFDVFHG